MSRDEIKSINQTYPLEPLENIENISTHVKTETNSPIDNFTKNLETYLTNLPSEDPDNPLNNLIVLGIVSTTELYLRELIAKTILICPTSQKHIIEHGKISVSIAFALWNQNNNAIYLNITDQVSFTSRKEIISTIKNTLDIDLKNCAELNAIWPEWDKVCNIRHVIVHSNGITPAKNAIKIGLPEPPKNKSIKIKIDRTTIQSIAAICHTLAHTINNETYKSMALRFKQWEHTMNWSQEEKYMKSKELFKIYRSKKFCKINNITDDSHYEDIKCT